MERSSYSLLYPDHCGMFIAVILSSKCKWPTFDVESTSSHILWGFNIVTMPNQHLQKNGSFNAHFARLGLARIEMWKEGDDEMATLVCPIGIESVWYHCWFIHGSRGLWCNKVSKDNKALLPPLSLALPPTWHPVSGRMTSSPCFETSHDRTWYLRYMPMT